MVRGEVVIELALSRSLYDFGNDGDDGYGAVVRWISWIAGLVDRVDKGVFPGLWDDIGDEGGVDQVEKDVADGVEG